MNPFKIGDRVRRIVSDFRDVHIGGIYVVRDAPKDNIMLVNSKYPYLCRFFELVEEDNYGFSKDE